MIKIRLSKIGKKKDFTYRIVAIEHKSKNKGKTLEVFGRWHPRTGFIEIDHDAVKEWLAKGAQMSETVSHLMEGKTKPKKVKEVPTEEPTVEASAEAQETEVEETPQEETAQA